MTLIAFGLDFLTITSSLLGIACFIAAGVFAPTGAPVVEAFLDVETTNQNQPLRNCRVMLVGLHTYSASTHWQEDPAYSGQTYFFTWRGKEPTVEARDVQGKERANIAQATRTTKCEWMTTGSAIGRIGHGDQYRLKVKITADNSLSLQRDYWVRIGIGGDRLVIEDWGDAKHEHALLG